jgi:hypothetical protein
MTREKVDVGAVACGILEATDSTDLFVCEDL